MISSSTLKKAVQSKRVLIDSNIIIYLTDSVRPYDSLAQALFRIIEAGEAEAVFSILSISEVVQGPLRKGNIHLAKKVRDYLLNFPNTHCQEITFDVLEKIGDDNRIIWNKLRTVDSLIICSGLVCDIQLIVSNDKHFKASLPRELILSFN